MVPAAMGLKVCTQEKSIITPPNGEGGDFKPKTGKKENKRERWRTWYKAVFL